MGCRRIPCPARPHVDGVACRSERVASWPPPPGHRRLLRRRRRLACRVASTPTSGRRPPVVRPAAPPGASRGGRPVRAAPRCRWPGRARAWSAAACRGVPDGVRNAVVCDMRYDAPPRQIRERAQRHNRRTRCRSPLSQILARGPTSDACDLLVRARRHCKFVQLFAQQFVQGAATCTITRY